MKRKDNSGTRKPVRQHKTHMVRLGDLAYTRLMNVYTSFLKKVAMSPHLYPAYADRQVTISEVVSIIAEEYQCRLNGSVS